MSKHWISWVEIPVENFDRAQSFYEEIFSLDVEARDFGSFKMGIFHSETRDIRGALCYGEWYRPGGEGPLLYLDANPDLQETLDKVEPAGGVVLSEKKQISEERGYMALFRDTEGNRLALMSDS